MNIHKKIKTVSLLWLLLQGAGVNAQNVGIGTAIPTEKLTIASGNLLLENSTKGLMLNGADNAMITRGFDPFTSGKHTGLGRWGLYMEPNVLTVGIPNVFGKRMAVSAFDANSTVAKEILVVAQSGNVGINVSNPQWSLDVNGGMQIVGRLYVSGTSGTTGQVLTSNGLGSPSWQTLGSAFSNSTRFEASFSELATNVLSPVLSYQTVLNTNPTDVTIIDNSITINRSGLYHIEGYYRIDITFTGAPTYWIQEFRSVLGGRIFVESRIEVPFRDPSTANFRYSNYGQFSREVYLTAPATISCNFSNTYAGGSTSITSSFHRGRISGYLISD